MTTLYTEDFEGSFPGSWTKSGTQQAVSTQDGSVANTGSNSYKVDTTGASGTSFLTRSPTAGRNRSERFYLRVDTRPGVTFTIARWTCASGNFTLGVTSGGLLRAQVSGTGVNTAGALTNGQW